MDVSCKSAFLALVATRLPLVGTVALRAASSLQAPQSSDQSDTTAKSKQKSPAGDTSSTAKPAAAPATKSSPSAATTPTAPAKPAPSKQTPPTSSSGMVWVNTDSGIYHKPGTRYYGKTKQGKYMTEADAIKAGYRTAGKK